jgi:DNA-directed RNA polymerase specialized sigma24 family protein
MKTATKNLTTDQVRNLYRLIARYSERHCWRYRGNANPEPEDTAQEAWALWLETARDGETEQALSGDRDALGWLSRVVGRAVYRTLRKGGRPRALAFDPAAPEEDEDEPPARDLRAELDALVEKARLTPKQKLALTLRRQGRTFEFVGNQLRKLGSRAWLGTGTTQSARYHFAIALKSIQAARAQ